MKPFFIILNIILACLLVKSGVERFRASSREKEPEFKVKTVGAAQRKVIEKHILAHDGGTDKKAASSANAETPVETILKLNVFSYDRCPNATSGFMGGNARVTMTLVGTFIAGEVKGAIILLKSQSNNNNMFNNQGFMPFGGGRMMGIGRNRDDASQPSGTSASGTRTVNVKMRGGRTISMSARSGNEEPVQNGGVPRMMPGGEQQNSTSITAGKSYKQYVRLGETMQNGYKLVEVTEDKAVLTRGSDKTELLIQDPSSNAPKAAQPAKRQDFGDRFINAMQNMQNSNNRNMFNMMRMMNQNNQNRNNGDYSSGQNQGRQGIRGGRGR